MRAQQFVFFVAAVTTGIVPTYAAAPSCPAGKPVTAFKLLVEPPNGGDALPVSAVNIIEPGDRLKYEPMPLNSKSKGDAKVAILLAAASGKDTGHIAVLDVKPAKALAEWPVPVRASIVGVVFGPQGLNEHKIDTLVKKNPDLVLKLSDYVEQTSKVEALVHTLSNYQQSPPGSTNLQAALGQFSKQYGVSLPPVSSSTPSDQQAQQLLHALLPAFSSDPLAQSSMTKQSTGLAASVATFFMGPQFGVAAGGAVLLGQLHAVLFPRAEFRAALAEPGKPAGMNLCATNVESAKTHTRIAYLWALPIPNAGPPSAMLADNTPRIPLGWSSTIEVKCATVSQLRLLTRAREWHLVSASGNFDVPVKVSVGPDSDFLSLDLKNAKIPAGKYGLTAKWDWTAMNVAGNLQVLNFADYSTAKISQQSRDHLVSGAGTVKLSLSDADFEFLKGISLLHTGSEKTLVARLPFSFPDDPRSGEEKTVTADVNTSHLKAGAYLLQLTQLNGKSHEIPVTVHPTNPTLAHLPVRVNLGEAQQTIELRGTGLDRIEKITSDNATWTLAAAPDSRETGEREATIHLNAQAKKGSVIAAKVFVSGIEEPLEVPGLLRVAGPRPKIVSARKSFASEGGVELHEKEIPENSEVSFSIQGANFDSRSRLHLECQSPEDTRHALDLTPGQRNGADELDFARENMLFLSVNAGQIGESGCALVVTLTDDSTGTSDEYFLGQMIRLPRIDKFTLTDEKLSDGLYAGILTGQDLQEIAKTGWDAKNGVASENIPTPVPGQPGEQTLKIAMPWPPPYPGASLYVWLSGEPAARRTSAKYQ